MEDNELRQAIAAMESYKERVEALSRQVQVLRVSLEEVTMSSDALKAFKNAKEGDEDEIDKWSLRNSSVFLYFGKEWTYLSDVARSIPILAGYNPSTILDKNKYLELRDDSFVYIVRISDYRLKGNTEPYEMAKPRIATLILNQRKKDFIKQLENDIYNEGVKNKKITIRK